MTLTQSNATTLRGGSYASTNYSSDHVIETRASDDPTYERRALLKFDTDTTIAAGASITSAKLIVTVEGGTARAARSPPTASTAHMTRRRRRGTRATHRAAGRRRAAIWNQVPHRHGDRHLGIEGDVRRHGFVQAVVKQSGTRYTRIALVDDGRPARILTSGSGRRTRPRRPRDRFSSSPSANRSSAPSTSSTGSTSTSGTQLRVLQYNTHHGGYGTDGRYDTNRVADWIVKMKPDVVLLNEIEKYTGWGNQNQPEVYKNLLQSKTGKTWYYIFAQEFGDWSSNGKGNLILSRVPLKSTDRHEMRPQRRSEHRRGVITWGGRPITLIPHASRSRLARCAWRRRPR